MLYPTLQPLRSQKMMTEQFLGLDRRPRTNDGAFADMQNMSGDPWPLLCSRKRRGLLETLSDPQGIISNNGLLWIDGNTLYKDGAATALDTISTDASMRPKRLIAMGAYVLIWPDMLYYNTADGTDYGSINRMWEQEIADLVTFEICDMDGVIYPDDKVTVSVLEPQNPAAGDYWLDTSQDTHLLRKWNQGTGVWTTVPTVYIKISGTGIGAGLSAQDSVKISGIDYQGEDPEYGKQLALLNNTHIVQAVGGNYIVVTGIIDARYTQGAGIRADREAPVMDYICECNNRLWGCRYGAQDGQTVNEIYASALGDMKNWRKYMGTSQDSYAVSVGTEGPFTGAIGHRGQPYFFKENAVHKIFGEKPSNFQMQTTVCDGVRSGCADTLLAINGSLYYMSLSGLQAFESLPTPVGKALGPNNYVTGCAGEYEGKYYLSVKDDFGDWGLYVMDTERGVWHREDESHAIGFAKRQDEIYMLRADGKVYALQGTAGEPEGPIDWWAESAAMGYELSNHKYISRFVIRLKLTGNAWCSLKIQYDGDGEWHQKGSMAGQGKTRTYVLPVVPRRCDAMKIRLEGQGDVQIYTISRIIEAGADGQSKGPIGA